MRRLEKYDYLIVLLFICTIITIDIIRTHDSTLELNKSSSELIAKVNSVEATRGVHVIYVNFLFHGKPIEAGFTATDIDSLKPGVKIRIQVASANPENIRYIRVEQ